MNVKFCFAAMLFAASANSWSYNNEPDGFRGAVWGKTAAEIPVNAETAQPAKLIQLNGQLSEYSLKALAKITRFDSKYLSDLGNLPFDMFARTTDHLTIGNVKTGAPYYFFFEHRLVAVLVSYKSTLTRPADVFAKDPPNFSAGNQVDKQLAQQYGEPTVKPSLFAKMAKVAFADARVIYNGEKTTIYNECDGDIYPNCNLAFLSTSDWDYFVKKTVAALEERKRDRAAVVDRPIQIEKPKSDF